MPAQSSDFNNRRKFVRANVFGTARYIHSLNGKPVEIQTRISDISEGGVLLITFADRLAPGTLIKVSFVIPGGQLATMDGRVKYTKALDGDTCQSGIEFLRIEQKDQLSIRQYVATHIKK